MKIKIDLFKTPSIIVIKNTIIVEFTNCLLLVRNQCEISEVVFPYLVQPFSKEKTLRHQCQPSYQE